MPIGLTGSFCKIQTNNNQLDIHQFALGEIWSIRIATVAIKLRIAVRARYRWHLSLDWHRAMQRTNGEPTQKHCTRIARLNWQRSTWIATKSIHLCRWCAPSLNVRIQTASLTHLYSNICTTEYCFIFVHCMRNIEQHVCWSCNCILHSVSQCTSPRSSFDDIFGLNRWFSAFELAQKCTPFSVPPKLWVMMHVRMLNTNSKCYWEKNMHLNIALCDDVIHHREPVQHYSLATFGEHKLKALCKLVDSRTCDAMEFFFFFWFMIIVRDNFELFMNCEYFTR